MGSFCSPNFDALNIFFATLLAHFRAQNLIIGVSETIQAFSFEADANGFSMKTRLL